MLKKVLYYLVIQISRIHNAIADWNVDSYGLSDKQLHFLIIGLLGMALFFLVQPVFKRLAERGHVTAVSWVYVFTVVLVVTFAIEIGQDITKTGSMEFADIVFGVLGFAFLFAVFLLIRHVVRMIARFIRKRRKK